MIRIVVDCPTDEAKKRELEYNLQKKGWIKCKTPLDAAQRRQREKIQDMFISALNGGK